MSEARSIDVYWRLPTHGDPSTPHDPTLTRGDWTPTTAGSITPGLRDGRADRYSYVDHLADVARAAEISGFVGGLIPSFPMTDDPWVIAPALANETSTFRFMIAFQPGFLHPLQTAHLSATLQQLSGGRLVFNIITGGGGPEQLWWGDPVAHDDRYDRTREFLEVLRGVWGSDGFDYHGRFYDLAGAKLPSSLRAQPFPELYFSGSSDAGIDAGAAAADYYLSWLEPIDQLAEKFDRVRERAAKHGRTAKFAVRVDVLARETHDQAWRDVRRAFEAADLSADRPWARNAATESVGARRQAGYQPTSLRSIDDLVIAPGIWAGFHLLRPGPAIGIVGDYAEAAARLDDLIAIGVDSFILAGTPHLEEAYRVGEEVLPLLRGRTLAVANPSSSSSPEKP